MNGPETNSLLESLQACQEAKVWTAGRDFHTAWMSCERADWMVWICSRMLGRRGWPTLAQLMNAVSKCLSHSENRNSPALRRATSSTVKASPDELAGHLSHVMWLMSYSLNGGIHEGKMKEMADILRRELQVP